MARIEGLRTLAINRSMTSPILLLGCDRIYLLILSLSCAYMVVQIGVAQRNIMPIIVAVIAWFGGRAGLRKMGKVDPQMREVIIRSAVYNDKFLHSQYFIPAKASFNAPEPLTLKKSWY